MGKIIPGDTEKLAEGWLNREFLSVMGSEAVAHGMVGAWIGHAQDAGLLIQRYRHAVRKSEGEEWFNVFPRDKPAKKAARKAAKKARAKRKAV